MQEGDYSSYYHHQYPQYPNASPNPNPNQSEHLRVCFGDHHAPPSAPAAQPPPPSPPATSLNPNSYSAFNQPPTYHPPVSPYGSLTPYQQSATPPMYYPPFDQHQTSAYPPLSSAPAPNPNPPQYSSSLYSAPPYTGGGSSIPPSYEKPYDKGGADRIIYTENDLRAEVTPPSFDDSYGDGVFAYSGGKVDPYGSPRGTAPKSSNSTLFDDYGRSISLSSGRDSSAGSNLLRSSELSPRLMCRKIGLDGLRMLDPSTSPTLRIYLLENITRCELFGLKTPVNIEAKRIRLQSNSYTTNTLLDTVTAAMFQAKEIWGSSRPPVSAKLVPDEAVSKCTLCGSDFGAFNLRHHCRNCGDDCSQPLTAEENAPQIRVFDRCMAEVSQRLSYAKESASRNVSVQSYGDLARKLLVLGSKSVTKESMSESPLLGSKTVTTKLTSKSPQNTTTDKSEYDDQNTDEPSSVITQLPHMHAVWSLRSDRAWLELGRYAELGRYIATERDLFRNVDTTLVHAFSSTLRCYLPKTVANPFHVSRHSKSSIKLYGKNR
uniref:FYVE zinc finger domain-containing protein n=1 Tax=Brassica oleracea TaxID=3712 RepID=A0A3P6DZV6_BRAOL|nr:unnamed protein product [Brassica oleracea]